MQLRSNKFKFKNKNSSKNKFKNSSKNNSSLLLLLLSLSLSPSLKRSSLPPSRHSRRYQAATLPQNANGDPIKSRAKVA